MLQNTMLAGAFLGYVITIAGLIGVLIFYSMYKRNNNL